MFQRTQQKHDFDAHNFATRNSKTMKTFSLCAALLMTTLSARAHDTWIETNTNVFRVGDAVGFSLMLGNHGNNHRDFKMSGKLDIADATLNLIAPNNQKTDLKPRLRDVGYAPEEGFWTGRSVASQAGLYTLVHTLDAIASYAPTRNVKSAKTFFIASRSLDRVPMNTTGFNRVLNLPFEIVPEINPVAPRGPGTPLTVRVYHKGKPLANTVVSFIPRGENLTSTFDARYERRTNINGRATFEPKSANMYLVVAHHTTNESGQGYTSTKYSATMTVFVPQVCPCCG